MASLSGDLGVQNERLQVLLQSLSKCKIVIENEREELINLRKINSTLEVEVKEARELEKSHRYHLQTSREMIGNLQETVSQLMYLKRDIKRLKDEMSLKDFAIYNMKKEKETLIQEHNGEIASLQSANEKQIEEIKNICEKRIQQMQNESDTQIAQYTCVVEELRSKIKDVEVEHRDKMNVVVLEYEEKIQRGAAQITQLQDQLTRQSARTDSNIDAYRRRLEELEEKLKQSQFKQYLAQNTYSSQYESQVERPYSVDPYSEACSVNLDPVYETGKTNFPPAVTPHTQAQQSKAKPPTLQVMYYGNKTPAPKNPEKKGPFNITKKRKLYNEKDFQDF